MSGNGISVYLSLETSTPFSSSVALIVTSQMLLSVLAAIVLPSRSFRLLMSDPLGISGVGPRLALVGPAEHALGDDLHRQPLRGGDQQRDRVGEADVEVAADARPA